MKFALRLRIGGSLFVLGMLVLAGSAAAQVSGTVVQASNQAPIKGAIVSLQATTMRAVTAADGTFDLPGATGSGLVIVAAKKGFYNSSFTVNAPTSGVTIMVEAVPRSDYANYAFTDPTSCLSCHPDQYTQWDGSPMSQAGTNLWVYDIYDGTGTPGGMGGFVYTEDSKYKDSNPESECASCHQPEPWVQTPFSALEDITQLSTGAMHGVSCDICHKIAHIDESRVNFPGLYPGAVTVTRPEPTDGPVVYGVFGDSSFFMPPYMRPSYQPQLTAAMCAACHQDKNDPDENGDFEEPNGVISEPTYLEWLATPYADPASPRAATCVDCHMPSYGANKACNSGGAPTRDPETIRHHTIEGTTASYLENAVELKLRMGASKDRLKVQVEIRNEHTGHHVPTGVTVRNMILLVEARRVSNGKLLASLGTQVVDDLGGVGNPKRGYYAGLPGKLFAKVNHDEHGNGPTFFTDATGILWDNRIPALATDTSLYEFQLPKNQRRLEDIEVTARLIYRRAFRSFVDAKQWKVDGKGNPLEDVQAPYYGHLMEEVVEIWKPRPRQVK